MKSGNLVVVENKIFEIEKVIIENNKEKFIISGLGCFYSDEMRLATSIEKFLYYIYNIKSKIKITNQ